MGEKKKKAIIGKSGYAIPQVVTKAKARTKKELRRVKEHRRPTELTEPRQEGSWVGRKKSLQSR